MFRRTTALGALAVLTFWASSSWAQAEPTTAAEAPAADEPEQLDAPKADDSGSVIDASSDAAATGDPLADAEEVVGVEFDNTTKEKEGQTYYFVGLRARLYSVPQFMMSMFGADGGTNVWVPSIGPEVGFRKDNFEYNLSISWADYSMDPTPFKAKTDPATAWEHVESEMSMIALNADFLWSTMFSDEFGLNYGIGAGIGFPFGKLRRTEVAPPNGNASAPVEDWDPCTSAGVPGGAYCEEGPKDEASWFDGGSKPSVFPLLNAQLGFRFKPHRNFAGRLDFGFGTSGFLMGVGLDYGL